MNKKMLLSAVSAVTLVTMQMASPAAYAFEKVEWDWYLELDVDLEIDERIDLYVDPKGATIVEVKQDFWGGDIKARADADDIKIDDVDADVSVSNAATAIGNGVIVETETALMAHIKQDIYADDIKARAELTDVEIDDVYDNVDVSNTAQAIANLVSLTVDPACGDCDEVDVKNLFAVVDVKQSADVNDIRATAEIDDYLDIDDVGGSVTVVNSALAAGNLVTLTVVRGSIEVDAP